jgi:hypothetical protein
MEKLPYHLFLDDERIPAQATWANYESHPIFKDANWIVARTFQQFKDTITQYGMPVGISFDHDIQDFHDGVEYTGSTCARWLSNYCLDNQLPLPAYILHSQNGEGVKNMLSILAGHLKIHPNPA